MSQLPQPTRRQVVLDAIAHRETYRIPHMILYHADMGRRLAQYYGVQNIDEVLDNNVEWIGDRLTLARMVDLGLLRDGEYTDEWGTRWHGVGDTRGQVLRPALPEPTLAGYHFPERIAAESLRQMKAQTAGAGDRYRVAKLGALWEQATFVRGMEDLLVDLLLHPRFVHELLDGILQYLLATLDVYSRELDVDCIWLSDDYGSQDSLLMSPALWRTFIAPRVARICQAVHSAGYVFALHSDGAVCEVVQDVVDMGVDLLHPVQSECVDVRLVKDTFGQDLTIWGGYGNQGTLVFGSPQEVRDEVNGLCALLGKGGGFILSPGLGLQNETPLENAVAFIEIAQEWQRGL